MACDIFHGTSRDYLPSIAEKGLLPREQLEALGLRITHPTWTKESVVYVCDSEYSARSWGVVTSLGYGAYDKAVVLCVDADVHDFDRNFPNNTEGAYEVLGPVSPDCIRIHIDGQCIALSEYVGRN